MSWKIFRHVIWSWKFFARYMIFEHGKFLVGYVIFGHEKFFVGHEIFGHGKFLLSMRFLIMKKKFWTCNFGVENFGGHVIFDHADDGPNFVLQNLKSRGSLQMLKGI